MRFFFIFRLLGTFIFSPWALSETECISFQLARRRLQENCWVRFSMGHSRFVCMSHQAWIQWLEQTRPQPICIDSKGKWRAFSPLHNLKSRTEDKKLFWIQKIKIQD